MKFLILNGPNLNLLGKREPGIYGTENYEALCRMVEEHASEHGSLLDDERLHALPRRGDGGRRAAIVINPGAYTHYSYAIHDALKSVSVPAYEVHISDITSRESFRAVSVTRPACVGQIYGQGLRGYTMAMDYFLEQAEP